MSWWVWKFGGSSLADYTKLNQVTNLINDQLQEWYEEERKDENLKIQDSIIAPYHLAVVVSAIGGVTSLLQTFLDRCREAFQNTVPPDLDILPSAHRLLDAYASEVPEAALLLSFLSKMQNSLKFARPLITIIDIHLKMVANHQEQALPFLGKFCDDILHLLLIGETILLCGEYSELISSVVLGYGELWSCQILKTDMLLTMQRMRHNRDDDKEEDLRFVVWSVDSREILTVSERMRKSDPRDRLLRREIPELCHHCQKHKGWQEAHCKHEHLPKLTRSEIGGRGSNKSIIKPIGSTVLDAEHYSLDFSLGYKYEGEDCGACNWTWAMPPLQSLPPCFFPPSGPVRLRDGTTSAGYIPTIDYRISYCKFANWFARKEQKEVLSQSKAKRTCYMLLITGFIARTIDGYPTTLQRNGSDTSSVAFGALLRAEGITIWSDVAGIYSGDPRLCSRPHALKYLCYEEALELAGVGAKVLHPASLLPSMHMNLPLLLKSTFEPQLPGTMIADRSHMEEGEERSIYGKMVSLKKNVVMLTLSNVPLVSLPNFASRFFTAVDSGHGRPLFISQGSATSALSIAVGDTCADEVLASVYDSFKHDFEDYGSRLKLSVDSKCSIVSIVGGGKIGAMAAWCSALSQKSVSIRGISQSTSELSTTFIISEKDEQTAIEALHECMIQAIVI